MNARPSLAALLLLAGCVVGGNPPPDRDVRHASGLPDADVVSRAVARLAAAVADEHRDWPRHLPRSRDFPELPLARVQEAEDLGRTGADMEALTRAIEQELRRVRLVRLSSDEAAVPDWLREREDGQGGRVHVEPAKPGLWIKAWTDRGGRLTLELHDLVTGERVARVRSR